jgi:hypothetical protein
MYTKLWGGGVVVVRYQKLVVIHPAKYRYKVKQVRGIEVIVFWVGTPCSDVIGYLRFGEPCCLHLQGEVTSLKGAKTLKFRT